MSYNSNLLGDAEQGSQYSRYDSGDDYSQSYLNQSTNRSFGQSVTECCSGLTTKAKSNKKVLIGVGAIIAAIIFIIILVVASHHENDGPNEPWLDFRLPQYIRPTSQTIDIRVDVENNFYNGHTTIFLNITEPTNVILIHSEIVTITKLNVTNANNQSVESTFFHYDENDFLVIQLTEPLPVSNGAYVTIEFSSEMDGYLRGLYNASYKTTIGNVVKMAITQFEPTDARRAWPCFDEPAMKAQFTINVEAPLTSNTTLSNMPEIARTNITVNGQPWYRVEFAPTPRMSTYLVAIAISDWAKTCGKFKGDKELCVYASPEKIAAGLGQEALKAGILQINKFAEYFDLDFPLPKMDMVTVVMSAGAMENWGLITYRETGLMFNPARNTEAERQAIARVIAHELAHQWFGDSTTPKTWADLWLNEGFASWVQYLGLDAVYEGWQSQQQFLTDTASAAFTLDSLPVPGTHPIVDPSAQTPAQISALFDSISYNKGASLIRAMASFLSPAVFQDGLQRYLKRYELSNADSTDLMTVLTEASVGTPYAVNVNDVMNSYLTQPGYPLLTVSFQNNSGVINVFVSQSHYLSPPNSPVDTSTKWHVPINWRVYNQNTGSSAGDQLFWLPDTSDSLQLPFSFSPVASDLWFKLNFNQGFFYRVMYPLEHWDTLAKYISPEPQFSIEDRTGLIMDAFALARSGQLDWPRALNMLIYFGGSAGENALTPITAVLTEIDRLAPFFRGDDDSWRTFETFCHKMLSMLYLSQPDPENPPPQPVNHVEMMIWQRVFSAAARYSVEGAESVAEQQFAKAYLASDASVVPAEITTTVFTVGLRMNGLSAAWDWVNSLYQKSADAAASNRYLAGLASVGDDQRLTQLIGYAFNGVVKSADTASVLVAVCNTDWALFDRYMQNNFNKVTDFFKSGYSGLGKVIEAWVGSIRDVDTLTRVQTFMTEDRIARLASARSAYNGAVLNAQSNIQFKTNALPAILQWMQWYNQQEL